MTTIVAYHWAIRLSGQHVFERARFDPRAILEMRGQHDGQEIFIADQQDGEQSIQVRGMWDNISATTCRWQQATSRDGGQSWPSNWLMDWVRA